MIIAIASGKGGTGKTTVATNLALLVARAGRSVLYADCDVEEPNGHIFLRPTIAASRPVGNLVPQVDDRKCTSCGKCGEICQYSAIVCIGKQTLVYPELCHSCGGCGLVCRDGAITENFRETGRLERGEATVGAISFVQGMLNVGEPMSPPLIRSVRGACGEAELVILDAPPGTSCPVIQTVRCCDYVVLVTEPTPFGLHDLRLSVEMVRSLGLRFGVVVNRAEADDDSVQRYCRDETIPVLCEIPDDRGIAEAYSRGQMLLDAAVGYESYMAELLDAITREEGAKR